MFHCFTISDLSVNPGIDLASFDCLIPTHEDTPVLAASVKLLPVLSYIHPSLDTAQFGLAFIKQETPTDDMEPGSIVSISSIEWGVCSRNSRMMLLDPCGSTGNTLLFLPPSY